MAAWNTGIKSALLAATIALAAPAMASTTIDLTGSAGSGTDGNSLTESNGGTSVTVSGWAVDSDGNVEDGALGQWYAGVGVQNSTGDNSHTIDNMGWTDFIVLQFSSSVILETVGFTTGWYDDYGNLINDTDAMIGYGNLAIPLSELPNWDELSAATAFSGFNFFSSTSTGSGSETRSVNPMEYGANTWIIQAANPNPDHYTDGFKISTVTFSHVPAVPEPATWLMLLLGFGLVGGILRKGKQKPEFAFG